MQSAGLQCQAESKRGWDHGVFVPLMCMFPAADIPVVAMSINASCDAALHLKVG
jgi:aromatic ring-opening dioxygenase catalytic subunit (LigB family)